MRIAIDIDSTLHHYWDRSRTSSRAASASTCRTRASRPGRSQRLEPAQLHAAVLETHSAPLIAAAVPYPGAVETVNAWHAAGHFIHITSHRATATP